MTTSPSRLLSLAGVLLAASMAATGAFAQHAGHDHGSKPAAAARPPAAVQAAARATGVIRKLDAGRQSASIAHDPVPSLSWPAMTMLFRIRDKAVFARMVVGAKIDFDFVQEGDDYIVTAVR